MLDEIDKLNRNSGVTGDPSAALLEVAVLGCCGGV
jgi:ATP-dependent Lon protease